MQDYTGEPVEVTVTHKEGIISSLGPITAVKYDGSEMAPTEIRSYAVLEKPPSSMEELTQIDFYTKSLFTLTFTENDIGKKGPWGMIEMVVIP